MNRHIAGFTIFEMVIVLIMVGILTAGLAPVLLSQHTRSQEDAERLALTTARDTLVSYGINGSGFPLPLTSAAVDADPSKLPTYPAGWPPANESYMPWDSYLTSVSKPTLGVSNFGSYRKYFWYDVRRELRSDYVPTAAETAAGFKNLSSAPTPQNFCTNVKLALAAVPAATELRGCRLPLTGEEATACPGGSAAASTQAFSLVSFGNDRTPDMAHRSVSVIAALARNYESPARAINHSHLAPPGNPHYDDMVSSVSLAELASQCDKVVSQQVCTGGQKILQLINGTAANLYYQINGGSCTTLGTGSGQQVSLGCIDPATTTVLFDNTAGCGSPFTNTPSPGVTIASLGADANNDGQVTFVLPANNTVRIY